MQIAVSSLRETCRKALILRSWPPGEIDSVVDEVLFTKGAGRTTHGVLALIRMLRGASPSKVSWTVEVEGKLHALIDGNGCSGPAVAAAATSIAVSKAEQNMLAVVGVKNSLRYFTPGYYAYKLAQRGHIGIVANNSTPEVAPIGGIRPALGTNPLAIGNPAKPIPFLLDMSTAQRAMGVVRLAKAMGKALPAGMALDSEGNPTDDANRVSALLPFGGYKGYGLAVAIEAIVAAIAGSRMSSEIKSERDWSYLFIAVNTNLFGAKDGFEDRVGRFFSTVRDAGSGGLHGVRIPDERAISNFRQVMEAGYYELRDETWDQLLQLTSVN